MKKFKLLVGQNLLQLIILLFLSFLMVTAFMIDIPLMGLLNDSLNRLFMNGVLVLSLIPMLNSGAGINYGLPIGISAGLLGMCLSVNLKLTGYIGFLAAVTFSLPISIVFGYSYGMVLNKLKGKEEIAGVFIGFSFVFIMSLFWSIAPFNNPQMLWPIGGHGLRPTIGLNNYFAKILNNLWLINIGQFKISIGFLITFLILCLMVYLFFKTKIGLAISVTGENETFARLAGINVSAMRILSTVLSTALGAVGICVYAQSYGFIELYEAPLMMAFPAASAILIGGSTGRKASVRNVIIGTFLFQSVYVITGPVANTMLAPGVSEILRTVITNGIILYALLYEGGKTSIEQKYYY
ncbi:ABC transporter permease subunit [Desulfofarcimen acetoxidans]|nr:ABC transporter permease [Desulfofarcimen acetoxidans]